MSVLLGNGNGTFQAQQTFATARSHNPWSWRTSTATASPTSSPPIAMAAITVSVLLGNGNGTFQAAADLRHAGTNPVSVAVAT